MCAGKWRSLKLLVLVALGGAFPVGAASAQTVVSLWFHSGRGDERDALTATVDAFNAKNKEIRIDAVQLPEGSYGDQVNAAALANKLPCLLDFDGPNVSNYAWSGQLIPLDDFDFVKASRKDFTQSIVRQGTYNGKLYSLGQFDSGLAIWGNKKALAKAGIRIPTSTKDAWTLAEFEEALKKLKASGVPYPLDMKFNYVGQSNEWFSYGFLPIVLSFGGDVIDRKSLKADGTINGSGTVQALQTLQGWVKKGYVNAGTKSDNDFTEGKSALSLVGHWVYTGYKKVLGSDLVLIPMPRFGSRIVTGAGSWNWGISRNCTVPQAAAKVLDFILSKEEILRMTNVNGAVPARLSAVAESPNYGPNGALRLYVEQISQGMAVVRPETPAYPVISTAFGEAVNNVVAGAEVKVELQKAAKKIDQAIEDNQGYPAK
jgi:multiple sugar transport system substrate-binding protein